MKDINEHANCWRVHTYRVVPRGAFLVGTYNDFGSRRTSGYLSQINELKDEELHALAFQVGRRIDYLAYLATERWADLRAAALDAAGHRCALCNKPDPEHVHHRTYERFGGDETIEDLLAVCKDCHAAFHARRELHVEGPVYV